ncbi:hypothetical protein Cob_v010969 [Colletotrichum orbiculare MAFF 240422]|uniref:Uncharacterized protein n=1 Tax=Colletotrichum orbiculare (strain 104-T / ATCC 96160 / CBS 514.97 / LARS 414 / MAFF 240422) TaxID=1213857 RepID=A0A484FC85_COLOR|nr:hypothetical protein Cob_v010969 [Colletotrichum orbiculare MAFF 240422]
MATDWTVLLQPHGGVGLDMCAFGPPVLALLPQGDNSLASQTRTIVTGCWSKVTRNHPGHVVNPQRLVLRPPVLFTCISAKFST